MEESVNLIRKVVPKGVRENSEFSMRFGYRFKGGLSKIIKILVELLEKLFKLVWIKKPQVSV